MAVGDIFTLKKSIAPCLVRGLYVVALILIALGTAMGLARLATAAMRPPPPPITTPGAAPMPQQGMAQPGMPGPRMMGPRHRGFGGGFFMPRPLTPWQIALRALLLIGRAVIAGLVIRILAEMALAILALKPKDSAAG